MPRISLKEDKGTNITSEFKIGDKVKVKPYNTEGRVASLWLKPEALLIEVRYYTDKERKYEYFYEDELEFVKETKTGFSV